MRTILGVNQLTNTAVSIWYDQVQKMHHGKPDFDLVLSFDDIATLVQHLTLDLAGATRERDAIHRLS